MCFEIESRESRAKLLCHRSDMRKAGGGNKIKIALRMRDAGKSVDNILAAIQ